MNFQLAAIILLVVLYPIGFRITKTLRMREDPRMLRIGEPSRKEEVAGFVVLPLFIATLIYLLISSWVLFLMMLGTGALLIAGTALISLAPEMSQRARDFPETYAYLRGRVKVAVFFGLLLIGGGIYVFILSIMRCIR